MHETTLARQLLTEALRAATEARATQVLAVHGTIAETEALSASSLQLHFQAHARGTVAENATLQLRIEHVRARCRRCFEEYLPEHHLLLCPSCGHLEADLQGKPGIHIDRVDVR